MTRLGNLVTFAFTFEMVLRYVLIFARIFLN